MVGYQRVARVLALHHAGQNKPVRQLHRHVLERMHGQVGPAFLQCHLQLLDEQALAAHLAERAVQYLVTAGGHAEQLDLVAQLLQQHLHVLCLPQGQTAFPGGNHQG